LSTISDRWTGAGVSDGTALTSANVATSGNYTGSGTWSHVIGGTPTRVYADNGFTADVTTGADFCRIEGLHASNAPAIRLQLIFTPPPATSGLFEILTARNITPTTVSHMRFDGTGLTFVVRDNTNAVDLGISPAIGAGDRILIDYVVATHSAPTTSNGRIFYRLTNKTNASWNTTGQHFYDSGYSRNVQIVNMSGMRAGKNSLTGTMPTATPFEFLGMEPITVNIADTSEAAAKAYFADDPSPTPVPLFPIVQAVQRLA
jgi:hypothetical protein